MLKTARNTQLIADFNAGITVKDIAKYYKISRPRVYVILKKYKRKSQNAKHHHSQPPIN